MSRQAPYDRAKRAVDVLVAGSILVVTSPVQATIAVMVARRLGTPVLFRQERPGLGGNLFTLVKFRTMLEVDESRGLVTDADRMTSLGRFLRSTSLDELPTLWNVLRGDMSLIGPRPLLPAYLPLYSPEQARRHDVRPGVTGLAQVSGRNAVSWPERFRLDVQYVDTRSPAVDAKIIWATLRTVLSREGVAAEGEVTMSPFTGRDAAAPPEGQP